MLITSWRIVKAKHAATASDGEGARVEGGRWNSPGIPVVYTSESAALAALEMLVHLGRGAVLGAYVLMPCTFDEHLVSGIDQKRLPKHWRSYPAPSELQSIGDEWAKSGISVALKVPSAIIPTDSNYLLNPLHRRFDAVRIGHPKPFEFDLRLLTA